MTSAKPPFAGELLDPLAERLDVRRDPQRLDRHAGRERVPLEVIGREQLLVQVSSPSSLGEIRRRQAGQGLSLDQSGEHGSRAAVGVAMTGSAVAWSSGRRRPLAFLVFSWG